MIKKNLLTFLVVITIMYLSLASSETFEKVPHFKVPFFDKIVHFCMYFGLMSVIIFENRKSLKTLRQLFLIALIPFFYGIAMELSQAFFTTSRSGSVFDALFNLIGILCSVMLWILIRPLLREDFR
jgi:VanZ family protein